MKLGNMLLSLVRGHARDVGDVPRRILVSGVVYARILDELRAAGHEVDRAAGESVTLDGATVEPAHNLARERIIVRPRGRGRVAQIFTIALP